jgi:hypothetical protein
MDRGFNGQYRLLKTLLFATSFGGGENMRNSWQNLLQKPSQWYCVSFGALFLTPF